MKKAVLENLRSFSMGPITMRPFAGDKLMIVRAELPAGRWRRGIPIRTNR
ncbi:hypothetical protein ATER59S_01066 [Aquamicrobium terrae]